jgi:hypothetical protein
MAKNRMDRDELADKLVETARDGEDTLRAMAELIADSSWKRKGDRQGRRGPARADHAPQRVSGTALGHETGHTQSESAENSRGRVRAQFH